jgi:magnesium transporter
MPGMLHPDERPARGESTTHPLRITAHLYDESGCEERSLAGPEIGPLIEEARGSGRRLWLDIEGSDREEIAQILASAMPIHPLSADILRSHAHRTSVDEFPGCAHIIMEVVHVDHILIFEKVDVLLGDGWLATVQDRPGDCFDGIRDRLRREGAFRTRTMPFLLHALAESVCQSYQVVLHRFGGRLEQLETRLIARPNPGLIHRIHAAKRDLRGLRRAVVPLRESIETLFYANRRWSGAGQAELACGPDLYLALRETHDALGSIVDILDAYRDAAQNLTDLYVTSASNRVNDILRVLTIISTIFIPLSFVAGIYGMNFERMPELRWRYGYPVALSIMAVIAIALLGYFWRKGWLRHADHRRAERGGHAHGATSTPSITPSITRPTSFFEDARRN